MSQTVWEHINDVLKDPAFVPSTDSDRPRGKGELVIVGSGIASIRQMTIEALDYIERADMVFYIVQDVTTEAFIQAHAKKAENMYKYYDSDKHRMASYTQMAEVMLASVRKGNLVVGVLYGHPGVFVNPSHRAIDLARHEGFHAQLLPGISAEDCLYADLGIDPATTGCSMFEATLLLLEKDRIDTRNHVIIWQPGSIGKSNMVFDNKNLYKLADYLEPLYGADYPLIVYMAAMFPLHESKIDRIRITDLRNSEVVSNIPISACSTIYLPPKTLPSLDWGGGIDWAPGKYQLLTTSAFRMSHPDMPVAERYGDFEHEAIRALESFCAPKMFKPLEASPALRRVAIKVALANHRIRSLAKQDIRKLLAAEPGLSGEETANLLRSGAEGVDSLMRGGMSLPPAVNVQEVGNLFVIVQNTIRAGPHTRVVGGQHVLVVA